MKTYMIIDTWTRKVEWLKAESLSLVQNHCKDLAIKHIESICSTTFNGLVNSAEVLERRTKGSITFQDDKAKGVVYYHLIGRIAENTKFVKAVYLNPTDHSYKLVMGDELQKIAQGLELYADEYQGYSSLFNTLHQMNLKLYTKGKEYLQWIDGDFILLKVEPEIVDAELINSVSPLLRDEVLRLISLIEHNTISLWTPDLDSTIDCISLESMSKDEYTQTFMIEDEEDTKALSGAEISKLISTIKKRLIK